MIILFITGLIISYLVGSLCSAILVSRLFSLPDPCLEGSKNPGATNVLRLAGKKYAIMVLIGDMLKGLLPVLVFKLLGASPAMLGFFCLAAVLGHVFPVFFGFKGGKGVATFLGALLGLHFLWGIVVLFIWIVVAKYGRYSSLASLISVALTPFLSIFAFQSLECFLPLLLTAALIIYRHLENISRLIEGVEPQMDLFKKN